MTINIDRLMNNLYKLGEIGYIEGKGANRLAYSEAFLEGRDYVKTLMEDIGMVTEIDAVGNLFGTLPSCTDDKNNKIK